MGSAVRVTSAAEGLPRRRFTVAEVEAMVAAGVIEEVRAAHRAGASGGARAALGFEELLQGDIEAMKRRTRNYAKRQLTWMRKLAGVELLDATERSPDDLAAALQ